MKVIFIQPASFFWFDNDSRLPVIGQCTLFLNGLYKKVTHPNLQQFCVFKTNKTIMHIILLEEKI